EAIRTTRPSSSRYSSGVDRGWPLRAPTVSSRPTGCPRKSPKRPRVQRSSRRSIGLATLIANQPPEWVRAKRSCARSHHFISLRATGAAYIRGHVLSPFGDVFNAGGRRNPGAAPPPRRPAGRRRPRGGG